MSDSRDSEPLIILFKEADYRTEGAYFWDGLRDALPAWKNLKYKWIAKSCFGDQIIVTNNSPIHPGSAVYMHGPDVAGPRSENPNWIDNILYLGPTVIDWTDRIVRFGDEHSIAPGSIDELLESADAYREIYRQLNPGLPW